MTNGTATINPNGHYANSWSWMIQGVLLERLKLVPVFSTVAKFCRTTALPIQEEHIPRLGVYIMPDDQFDARNGPEGNQGHPHFFWKTTFGFSYIVINNDPEITEDILDRAHWAIMQTLHDPAWHKWPGIDTPPMIEGITGGAMRKVYGTAGRQNETPIGEMQMEMVITHQWIFEPIVNDIFEAMRHQTVLPGDDDPTDPQRPPIVAEWTLPQ
jgi:hypothetical protein